MNLRNIESIRILKASVHVLDKRLEEPMIAQGEITLTEDITRYLMTHIMKASRSGKAQAASFKGEGALQKYVGGIFADPEVFESVSQDIARRMFQVIKPIEAVASCDLVTVLFQAGDIMCMALLKLDHKQTFQHAIEYVDETFAVKLAAVENALPQTSNQLTACALINAPDLVTETGLLIIEQEALEEGPRWFMHRYLGADWTPDRMELTRIFKDIPEKFARRHLKTDFIGAELLRSCLYDKLLGSAAVDPKGFADDALSEIEARDKLLSALQMAGLQVNDTLEIDRSWVNEKMKHRAIKTDTGFTIRAAHEFYDDLARFEMRRNGDGGIDYIIKNVRSVNEK